MILLINNRCPSRDEFTTFSAESIAIVNNAPLWSPSANHNYPSPLTPAMYLTLKSIPNPSPLETFSECDLLSYGQKRFRRVQYLASQFWQRWRTEYLHTFKFRHKWNATRPCISIDEIVLIRDKQSARNSCPWVRFQKLMDWYVLQPSNLRTRCNNLHGTLYSIS